MSQGRGVADVISAAAVGAEIMASTWKNDMIPP